MGRERWKKEGKGLRLTVNDCVSVSFLVSPLREVVLRVLRVGWRNVPLSLSLSLSLFLCLILRVFLHVSVT